MDSDLDFLNSRKTHTLNLGTSFQRKQAAGFHTLRYDFKPASVDKTKEGRIEVGDGNEVTLTLPHVAGSKQSCTVYKGSKKPVQKECLLIYDHDTGEFTLERISSQLQVKKTRMAGNVPTNFVPVLPPAQKVPKMAPKKPAPTKARVKNKLDVFTEDKPISPALHKISPKSSPAMTTEDSDRSPSPSETAAKVSEEMLKAINSEDDSQSSSSGSSDDSSSDNSSSSGSDDDEKEQPQDEMDIPLPPINLKDDLQLSESSSDSD